MSDFKDNCGTALVFIMLVLLVVGIPLGFVVYIDGLAKTRREHQLMVQKQVALEATDRKVAEFHTAEGSVVDKYVNRAYTEYKLEHRWWDEDSPYEVHETPHPAEFRVVVEADGIREDLEISQAQFNAAEYRVGSPIYVSYLQGHKRYDVRWRTTKPSENVE